MTYLTVTTKTISPQSTINTMSRFKITSMQKTASLTRLPFNLVFHKTICQKRQVKTIYGI